MKRFTRFSGALLEMLYTLCPMHAERSVKNTDDKLNFYVYTKRWTILHDTFSRRRVFGLIVRFSVCIITH